MAGTDVMRTHTHFTDVQFIMKNDGERERNEHDERARHFADAACCLADATV